LPLPLLFLLSFPPGICFFRCRCPCFSCCHSLRESASSVAVAVALAFLAVIPSGNPLLPLPLPLLFLLSFRSAAKESASRGCILHACPIRTRTCGRVGTINAAARYPIPNPDWICSSDRPFVSG